MAACLRAATPVLEARLAASLAVGHSGDNAIDLHTETLRLAFHNGRLVEVERATAGHGRPMPAFRSRLSSGHRIT